MYLIEAISHSGTHYYFAKNSGRNYFTEYPLDANFYESKDAAINDFPSVVRLQKTSILPGFKSVKPIHFSEIPFESLAKEF